MKKKNILRWAINDFYYFYKVQTKIKVLKHNYQFKIRLLDHGEG